MPLMPKRVKHRKVQKGRIRGNATQGNTVAYGEYGLQAMEPGRISARQIEAARVAATRQMPRNGRVWVRLFPDKPISQKPQEVRMGVGKGEPEYWASVVKPGTVMFEVGNCPEDMARLALNRAAHKLPVRARMLERRTF